MEIDVRSAVRAYDAFVHEAKASHRRKSSNKDAHLDDQIHLFLATRLLAITDARAGWYLASRKGIQNWRKNPPLSVRKRRGIIAAVYLLTDIDISVDQVFASGPSDFSEIVELGQTRARRISNQPTETGRERYELALSSALFTSGQSEVRSSWIAGSDNTRLGSVAYRANGLELEVDGHDVAVVEPAQRLDEASLPEVGVIRGCTILWSEKQQCWLVRPASGAYLEANLSDLSLTKLEAPRDAMVRLSVNAREDQIDTFFSLTGESNPSRETKMRERLMGLILARRGKGGGTLSISAVSLE